LAKNKSNSHKILSSKTNKKKSIIIPEPENICHGIQKQNTRYICSKDNTKDNSLSKKMLMESVSTLSKGSEAKNVGNRFVNRPPFK